MIRCPTDKEPDRVYYGFGTGITPGTYPGESFLFGRKIVGWQGDTPMTMDPATGQVYVHNVDMTTGAYMPGIAMPTTITARHGGRGPIATSPTGSGRVFWAPDNGLGKLLIGFLIGTTVGFGLSALSYHKTIKSMEDSLDVVLKYVKDWSKEISEETSEDFSSPDEPGLVCATCGAKLEDVGSYKKDCPNGCIPVAMEEGELLDHGYAEKSFSSPNETDDGQRGQSVWIEEPVNAEYVPWAKSVDNALITAVSRNTLTPENEQYVVVDVSESYALIAPELRPGVPSDKHRYLVLKSALRAGGVEEYIQGESVF